jgi:hypothetical protein
MLSLKFDRNHKDFMANLS